MDNKQINTPALRFPPYTEGWVGKKFNDIFIFSTGKNIKQNEASPEFVTPCVRYGELYHMYNEVINEVINKTNLNKSELLFSEGDEILLPSAGEDPLDIGSASALTIKNVAIGRTINILKPLKANIYSQIYVAYYINHKLKKNIATLAKGVSISNVYNSDLKTLEIILPTLPEQQKIAAFFTAIDQKLSGLKAKRRLLEQYKKGVMQQLFSIDTDGVVDTGVVDTGVVDTGVVDTGVVDTGVVDTGVVDTGVVDTDGRPYLRFKDTEGGDFEDWEVRKLGEVCECLDNVRKPLNDSERQKRQGKYPYWGANNIMDYIDDYIFDETIVLLAEDGGNFNDFKNRPIANLYKGKCWVNNHTHVLKGIENVLLNEFLFYSIVHKDITGFVSGGTRAKLTKGEMLKIPISIPSLAEQTQIANFLSALDEKIKNTEGVIGQMETWKKGLLQQMFV
jgi:type I restriction enzyme, S subunit